MTRIFDNQKIQFALRLARHAAALRNQDCREAQTPAFRALYWSPVLAVSLGLLVFTPLSRAQTTIGPVTVGAGIQTSFQSTSTTGGTTVNQLLLDSARIYISGDVTENIKLMFNTEYDGSTNKIGILDAAAEIPCRSPGQLLGWSLPAAQRSGESLRTLLCERV